MLKTVFSKTIFEKRWAMLWWWLAMFLMTLLVVVLFPTFRDSFGQSLQNVPDSLKSVLGEASDYQRIEGFLELQVLMQMVFFTVIYAVILCTGLIAGEEGQGTLGTLLTNPINRTRIYFEKLAASAVILAIVSMGMLVGIWLGAVIIGESVNYWLVLQATFAMWLLTMVFGLLGYSLGAVMGRRGVAGGIAGAIAFTTYMITSLAGTASVLKTVNNASPFKYFNNTKILTNGLQADNMLVLASACVLFGAIGWIVFNKRDIFQR
jgi:ABC-2 type transport system permease protein